VKHVREDALKKIDDSAFVASIVPPTGANQTDVKFCVELGIAIMLDKPILAVATEGRDVPPKLRRVADTIVFADIDTEEGRREIAEAIEAMRRRLGE
jgi:nucleoside 2-deoxyribosyltransferase